MRVFKTRRRAGSNIKMENHKNARNTARENVLSAKQKIAEVREQHTAAVLRATAALARAKQSMASAIQSAKRDVERCKKVLANEMRLYNASKIKKSAPSETLQRLQAKIAARKLKNETPKAPKQPRPKPAAAPVPPKLPECQGCGEEYNPGKVYKECGHVFPYCADCAARAETTRWNGQCSFCRTQGEVIPVYGPVNVGSEI